MKKFFKSIPIWYIFFLTIYPIYKLIVLTNQGNIQSLPSFLLSFLQFGLFILPTTLALYPPFKRSLLDKKPGKASLYLLLPPSYMSMFGLLTFFTIGFFFLLLSLMENTSSALGFLLITMIPFLMFIILQTFLPYLLFASFFYLFVLLTRNLSLKHLYQEILLFLTFHWVIEQVISALSNTLSPGYQSPFIFLNLIFNGVNLLTSLLFFLLSFLLYWKYKSES